jgi:hypothetical protein
VWFGLTLVKPTYVDYLMDGALRDEIYLRPMEHPTRRSYDGSLPTDTRASLCFGTTNSYGTRSEIVLMKWRTSSPHGKKEQSQPITIRYDVRAMKLKSKEARWFWNSRNS